MQHTRYARHCATSRTPGILKAYLVAPAAQSPPHVHLPAAWHIRLGPSLPAFITPNVLAFLVQNFDIKPITTPDEDLKAILG